MNDLQVIAYVAQTPDTRAVQVADKFNVALEDARKTLDTLVAVGDLATCPGLAPNGLKTTFYNLTHASKSSPDVKKLVAQQEASGKSESRADRAISFIRQQGSANDADLRELLGLRVDEFPSTILYMANKKGLVARDGGNWVIGSGERTKPLSRQKGFGGELVLPGSTPDKKKAKQSTRPSVQAAPTAAAYALRCAIWSDGQIELQRDGRTICALQAEEAAFLSSFVSAQHGRLPTAS